MRIFPIFAAFTTLGLLRGVEQPNDDPSTPVVNRSYDVLRDSEDWSFLRNRALRSDFWDPIKYVRLRGNDDTWYLTMGGEIRYVWEQIGNDNWGQRPLMNGYLLQRYMFHVDTHYGKHVRSFVQLKSGLESFRADGPRLIDQKKLDIEAAYVEMGTAGEHNWIRVRAGRQELNYGSGRLVSVREGPNVRHSFDGIKILSSAGSWSVDAFAVRPDVDKPGYFNNSPDHRVAFWGLYATRPTGKRMLVDAYYLGIDRKRATFNRGTARETRQSLGARIARPASPEAGWDFDYEGVWQFGSFGSADIRAWTIASDTGYGLPQVPLKPRLSLKADISSGDNPKNGSLGTFNPLFPIGNYFGVISSTGPGPINFIDVHPRVQTTLPHGVSVSFDWVVEWRQSIYDGVYAVPGFLIRPAGNSDARFVGHRPGLDVRWQVDRHSYFQADYGIFYAGKFLKETMPGRNLNYWAFRAGYKF